MTVVSACRRGVLAGIGATTVALLTGCSLRAPFVASNPAMHRIGYLTGNQASSQNIDPDNAVFRQGLRDLGYVEGQNLTIAERSANFNNDLLPDLAAGLLEDGVEVLVTSASPAAVAAKRATQTVPVVFMEAGLIARSYGLQGPEDVAGMLAAARADGAEALVLLPSTPGDLETIISFAANARLPILGSYRNQVVAGALMSFAPAYLDLRRRAATYVDKILRGAKAGDLPVEQPQRFDIVLNLATARAMGVTFSDSVRLQATELFQ